MKYKYIFNHLQRYWSPSVCMEFCSKFLKLVAKQMQSVDSAYDVIRFEYDPTKSNTIFMGTHKRPNDFSFLPEWFIQEMEKVAKETA